MKTVINVKEFKNITKELNKVKNVKSLPEGDNIQIKVEDNTYITKNVYQNILTIKTNSGTESGEIVLDNDTIKLLNKLKSGDIEFSDNVIVNGKKNIKFENVGFYEKINLKEFKNSFKVTQEELLRLLEVNYAKAQDETRPILQGVCFKNNEVFAVDGYRLSKRTTNEFNCNTQFVINSQAPDILINLLNESIKNKSNDIVNVDIFENYVIFSFDNYKLTSLLLEGTCVNIDGILTNSLEEYKRNEITITDTNKFIESLEFVKESKDNTQGKQPIILNIKDNKVVLSSCKDSITEELDYAEINSSIEDLRIGFNPKYLIELSKKCYKNKNFKIIFATKVQPAYITTDNLENVELVLPVRLRIN